MRPASTGALRAILAMFIAGAICAASPSDYVVQIQAATQVSPPRVTLSWVNVPGGSGYSVSRRTVSGTADFASVASGLPATASGWTDNAVSVGTAYEYRVHRTGVTPDAYGYAAVGIDLPLVDNRGTVVLLVDRTQATALSSELLRLQADLAGDGWKVIRHDVAKSTARFQPSTYSTGSTGDDDKLVIPAIKAQIVADANADPAVSHVLIVGNVPVPYSGNLAPDGHDVHIGAWPADVYYGDLDGVWTDTVVNTPYAFPSGGDNSSNLIGDGRFDQDTIPGTGRQLAVGRVDLSRMPAFQPASEADLLRRYLGKEHAWRTGQWSVPAKCLVDDATFGDFNGQAVAGATGWEATSVVGLGNVVQGDWMTSLPTTSYLYAVGAGYGGYQTVDGDGTGWNCQGVVNTANLLASHSLGVFTSLLGSYFIDWNRSDDLLRCILANDGYGLTCVASGRPCIIYHRMAMGGTVGDCWQITQDHNSGRYPGMYFDCERSVHFSLMGDPTLRAHPVAPPGTPTTSVAAGGQVALGWSASSATGVVGYHVYRATSTAGPFTRISGAAATAANPSGTPVTGTTWTDTVAASGTYTYLVKAIKRQVTPGGTFYNNSLGSTVTVTVNVGAPVVAPTITTQPQSQMVTAGNVATFTVVATGTPAPTYQWRKGGVDIAGATSASYAITAALSDTGSVFSVVVRNSGGIVTSANATLTVNPAPAGGAVVFRADFNGTGGGTGGSTDLVSVGGVGTLLGNAAISTTISGGSPLANGGSYLASTVHTAGYQGIATFNPAAAGNSFACFNQGTVASGGKTQVVLNGAYDVFARLDQGDPSDLGSGPNRSSYWFQQFAINNIAGTRGLAIILNGLGFGAVRLQVSGGAANAITNVTRVSGNGTATVASAQDLYIDSMPDLMATVGTTYHVAFTLATASNGVITAKLFVAPSAVAIDTTATTYLRSQVSFTLDASVVGAAPIGSGAWTMGAYVGSAGVGTSVDYDVVRLYNGDPGVFPTPSTQRSPVFQADFNGADGGTGGATDLVSIGGIGSLINNAAISNAIVAGTSASGSYLASTVHAAGYQGIATFNPAAAGNSFACFNQGTVASGGKTQVVLNGAYDVFAHLGQEDPSDFGSGPNRSSYWFQQFAIDNIAGTRGLAIILNGLGFGAVRLQVSGGAANAIGNIMRVSGNGTATVASAQDLYIDSMPDLMTATGTIYHVAFTLATASDGVITAKLFVAPGAVAIDTTATTYLRSQVSFTLDASVVGVAPIGSGAWTMGAYVGSAGAGTSVDYDVLRLYAGDPGVFPGLQGLESLAQPGGNG